MSDRERLLAAFDSGKLVRPSPGRLNIVDLANAIASIGGAQDVPYSPGAEPVADLIGPADHIVFVIVDGLGLNVLDTDHGADFLAAHVVAELATVFPSSTPTVLTSYATGLWPLSHGVPSWYLYLEEVDSIATIIHFSRRGDDKDLDSLGLTPDQAYPTSSLASKMAWSTFAVIPEKIADTQFSSYCRGYPQSYGRYGYKDLEDAAEAVLKRLREARGPSFTHLYIPHVDSASHEYGIGHDVTKQVIASVDNLLGRISAHLPSNAAMVVSADHGLVDVAADAHEMEPDDELVGYLEHEPWGTAPSVMLQARDDRAVEFEARFSERFGEDFYLLHTDEALELELLGPGPVSPVTRRRMGNYLALSAGSSAIYFNYRRTRERGPRKVADHGGLTPAEMIVPLIVARR